MSAARTTALFEAHRALGARMGDFGGWQMPLEYPTGVVAEHTAVRTTAGVFDVSHMGTLLVRGPGAVESLNLVLANDLARIGVGRAQYTMLCAPDGGVIDDLIGYWLADDEVLLVPNAANAATVRDTLRAALPAGVELVDRHGELGILAIQGPQSTAVVTDLGLLSAPLDYMAVAATTVGGRPALLCRTGYTGELGYEVIAEAAALPSLWLRATTRATPCGLGARDTLRTEMGYPLHGQDISRAISPVEAGLSWAVGWSKPTFAGREALLAQRGAGRSRALRGLRVSGRGIPRPGMAVLAPDGTTVGVTTSGTFSPTLRTGIALALVDPALEVGAEVAIDVRGRTVPALLAQVPFVDRSPRQGAHPS